MDDSLFNDWKYRMESLYEIITKQQEKILLKFNDIQNKLIEYIDTGWLLFIILKARQEGVSTFFLIWHLDATMTTENTNTAIIAHDRESLEKLFRIIKLAYESCPDTVELPSGRIWKKPKAHYDNVRELFFKEIGSSIYVALKVRSATVHRMHVTELAFIKKAREVMSASRNALVPGGVLTIESTAFGIGNLFHATWEGAVNGENDYIPIFFGFQHNPEYSLPIEDRKAFEESLDEKERWYMQHAEGMTLEALNWRRMMLRNPEQRGTFVQEYPAVPKEAFLTTGISPFDRDKIDDWIILDPIKTKMGGRLLIWKEPKKDGVYIAGCDTSSGKGVEKLLEEEKEGGTDYGVIQIYDCHTLQLCAMFRGKIHYSKLHEPLEALGRMYNDAYLVVENNNHGLTVLNNLVSPYKPGKEYPIQLIHHVIHEETKSKKKTRELGWNNNAKTRNLVLDSLAKHIIAETIRIHSSRVQTECLRFVIKEDGRMEAEEGYKDDCVIAAAIATHEEHVMRALKALREYKLSKRDLGL